MAERRFILLEHDDLMHPNTGESNFNESAYYNFFDRGQRLGGFVRLGNRPNEGAAEMTVCLYQPDATVGFMFQRPEIENNDAHDAGGLQFRVIKPFEHHRVSYAGKVCVLEAGYGPLGAARHITNRLVYKDERREATADRDRAFLGAVESPSRSVVHGVSR